MTVTPLLTAALRYGAIVAGAVGVVAGAIGWATSGWPGLLGGLLGALAAAVFVGLTAVSILIAGRVAKGDATNPVFFAIVLGVGAIKIVLFVIAAILLRGVEGLDFVIFFWAVIAATFGSLIADMVAFARTRIPYVSDIELPGDPPKTS
jgi:hypothetical protein